MQLQDCTWCGSAASIEYGVCQVCLMRFPEDPLPERVVIALASEEIEIEEAPGRKAAAAE